MKKVVSILSVLLVLTSFGCRKSKTQSANVLVFLNTDSPEVLKAKHKVLPYLDHFGLPYRTVDLSQQKLPASVEDYALVIVSHNQTAGNDNQLKENLRRLLIIGLESGTGLLSFDTQMPDTFLRPSVDSARRQKEVGQLQFSTAAHYITEYHKPGEAFELFGLMELPQWSVENAEVLLSGGGGALLIAGLQGKGRIVQWTTQDWMYSSVLGPMGGLDDCLWRSMVWAARKPFAMRGLPPIVTMRVDDVVGSGDRWNRTPFFWVRAANRYGFKPWLGLFIYNLTPQAIDELRTLIQNGQATASPHAFGRPPRPESDAANFEADYKHQMVPNHWIGTYYYPKALPYRSAFYDEFIYYDHNNKRPWPDKEALQGLKAVGDWYADNRLPMSKYIVPHWSEMGTNTVAYIADKWGSDFISHTMPLDTAWGGLATKIKTGPFLLYDEPVYGRPKREKITRPCYLADFIELAGRRFFNCRTMISDITGFEWKPDNDVEGTADRGVRTLERALNAMALAVLFTHETDYVFRIEPENWDKELRLVSEGISHYNPVYLRLNDALKIVRACRTSSLKSCIFEPSSGNLKAEFAGHADVPTSFYLFTQTGENINSRLIEVPVFNKKGIVQTNIND